MDMTDRTSPAPRREALGPWIRLQTHMTPSHLAWAGEAAAVAFVAAVAALAHGTGLVYVLFPELGALAFDTLKRPHGAWARAPVMLVATPTLAGAVGTLVTQHMAFGLGSVFLVLGVSLLIIKLLRSPVAPAMSAGLLPLVLGDTSWWYPPSLLLGLGLLAGASQLWRRHHPARTAPAAPPRPPPHSTGTHDYSWVPFFIAFIAVVTLLALGAGLRFLLFPPLAVIGYEMFAHAPTCPWAKRPFALPLACTLAAVAGVALVAGVGILRVLDLHAPPALAVALLPLIMTKPDYAFAGAVATTTLLLSGLFVAWRKMGAKAQPA
jgi:hypothetical protein